MKFSLISDMHVDFPQPKTPYDLLEKVVVVAGDTANGLDGLKFLQKIRNKGYEVVACDGNHEHYSNLSQRRSVYETAARFRENFSRATSIDGVPVVLANGWYCVSDEDTWLGYMNDGKRACLSAKDVNLLAIEEAGYIEEALQSWRDYQLRGVVVTHTSPCEETLDPRYEGSFSNEWYWNPHMRRLIDLYPDVISVWCHGHTHSFADELVNGVRVVCNPRGYPGENEGWKPFTIEV